MPRFLLVTHTPPWPPNNGGHQRTNLLLRALRTCGETDLLLIAQSPRQHPSEEMLQRWREDFGLIEFCRPLPRGRYFPWRAIRLLAPQLVDAGAGHLGDPNISFRTDPSVLTALERVLAASRYDLVVGRYLKPTSVAGAFAFAPLVLDLDDLDSDRYRTQLDATAWWNPLRLVLRRQVRQLVDLESKLLLQCEGLWVCSETDRAQMGSEDVAVLPNIPFSEPRADPVLPFPPADDPTTVLIVGSLKYGVNVRGIDRFVTRSWPRIVAACPTARFRIVGIGMTAAQRRRWARAPGVEPVGFVESLQVEYAACAFTIAPLFEGGGTKIKVLESFLFGRTCVVTRHAHRGFENTFRDGEAICVGGSDDTLADACIRLLCDPGRCATIAEKASQLVRTHFTFDRFASVVRKTVEGARGSGSGVARRSGAWP